MSADGDCDGWDCVDTDDLSTQKKDVAEGWDDLEEVGSTAIGAAGAVGGKQHQQQQGVSGGKPLFVELVGIQNLYKSDLTSESDAKVFMSLVSIQSSEVTRVQWPVIDDEKNPMWNLTKFVGIAAPGKQLKIEVYDEDKIRDDIICTFFLPVEQIKYGNEPMVLRLPAVAAPKHINVVTIRCRCEMPKRKKKIFVIRHGQSEWNEAQANKNVFQMLRRVDHPLTVEGAQQALQLAQSICLAQYVAKEKEMKRAKIAEEQEEATEAAAAAAAAAAAEHGISEQKKAGEQNENDSNNNSSSTANAPALHAEKDDGERQELDAMTHDFLNTKLVYVSPLCRALQTALLCLHSCHTEQTWCLKKNAREKRNAGGKDSSGNCFGEKEYLAFQLKELQELQVRYAADSAASQKHMFPSLEVLGKRFVKMDRSESCSKWWLDSRETADDAAERAADLIFGQCMWQDDADHIIIVGHSHYFRDLNKLYFSRRLREKLRAKPVSGFTEEQWCGGKWKLENCGTTCLEFDFQPLIDAWAAGREATAEEMACIENARMMFNTKLIP